MAIHRFSAVLRGWLALTVALLTLAGASLPQASAAAEGGVVFEDDFDSFGPSWHTAGGEWHAEGGVLIGDGRSETEPAPEPKYAYVEHTAPDIIVTADVTPREWDDADHRIGLSARVKGGEGDAKWNLIFHDGKLTMLEEGIAWKREIPFSYEKGQTYTFKLSVTGSKMSGKVWKAGEEEPQQWMVEDTFSGQLAADGIGLYAGHALAAFDHVRVVEAPSFSAKSLQPGNVFVPGETPGFKLKLAVHSSEPQAFDIGVTLRDAKGETVRASVVPAAAQDGMPFEQVIAFDGLPKGYYAAELALSRNGEHIQTVATSLAVVAAPPQGDGKDSPFGIGSRGAFIGSGTANSGTAFDEDEVTKRYDLIGKLGAKWVREEFFWNSLRPEKDGPYKWERFDFAAGKAREHRLNIMGILDYFSDWSMPYGDNQNVDMDEAIRNFAQYASDVVHYYKPGGTLATKQGWTDGYGVSAWEIWNEPPTFWFGSADDFGKLVKAASAAIREADPQAVIIVTNGGDSFDQTVYDQAGAASYDDLAIHLYPGPLGPERGQFAEQTKDTRGFLDRNGLNDAGIWVTEFGWDTFQVSELDQAAYLVRANAEMLEAGTERNFLFTFNYASEPPGWSVVHPDMTPKPSYAAYAEMAHQLDGLRPAGSAEMGSAVRAHLFEGNGAAKALLWSVEEKGTLQVQGTGFQAYDIMGNPVGSSSADGYAVPLDGTPVYLTADRLNAEQLGDAIKNGVIGGIAPIGLSIEPLDRIPVELPDVRVTVTNRTNKTEQGSAELTLPNGWKASSNRLPYGPLKPGESQKLAYTLTQAETDQDNAYDVAVLAQASDGGVIRTEQKLFALASAKGTPAIDGDLGDWQNPLPVTVDQAGQMVGIPNWTKADLSADIYTMWDEENFYFGAVVTDDKHVQNQTSGNIWQGDSFQIYFDMNNDKTNYPNGDDSDLGLAWNETEGPQVFRWTGGAYQGDVKDAKIAVKRDSQGRLVYEAAIPLTELGARLQPGQAFGFNLLLNDDDGNGRDGWGWWTPGVGNAWDPSQWSSWTTIETLPLAAVKLTGGEGHNARAELTASLESPKLLADIVNDGVRHLTLSVNGKKMKFKADPNAKKGELPLNGQTTIDLSAYAAVGQNVIQADASGPGGGTVTVTFRR